MAAQSWTTFVRISLLIMDYLLENEELMKKVETRKGEGNCQMRTGNCSSTANLSDQGLIQHSPCSDNFHGQSRWFSGIFLAPVASKSEQDVEPQPQPPYGK